MIQKLTKINPIPKWANNRIKRNKNAITLFLGPTGSGKTYAALDTAIECAKLTETKFSISNNVAFDSISMLKKTQLEHNDKKGTVFLLEEVGAVGSGASSHEWQSKTNSFFSSFMQTSRHRNQILIFTTPNFALLSKQLRMLCHGITEMVYIDESKKESYGKFKYSQTNPLSSKMYFKYPRLTINNERYKIKKSTFKLPPKDMLKVYEVVKREYTDKLNQQIIAYQNEKENKIDKKVIKKIQDDLLYEKVNEKLSLGLTQVEVAKILGTNTKKIQRLRKKYGKTTTKDSNLPNIA